VSKRSFLSLAAGLCCILASGCGGSLQKKATAYACLRSYQEGIVFFKQTFGSDTSEALDHFYIHREILRFYHKSGKLQEGLESYRKFKDEALQHYIKGVYYSILNIHDKALVSFQKAAQLRGKEFIIHYDLALTHRKLKKYGSARRALARCLQLNDHFGPAYYEMGMLYGYARHQHSIGQAFLKKAVERYGDFGEESRLGVKISLGRMLLKLRNHGEAVSIFEDVADRNFRMLSMSIDLGSLYLQQGDRDKALLFWKGALSLFGHNTIRGRYYFSRLNMYRNNRGGADLSGVAYYYVVQGADLKEKTVFADDEPFFFDNSPVKGLSYKKLLRSGLCDGKKGREIWIVEYAGSRSKAQMVRRWMQKRGIVSTAKFKDGRVLLVSVKKQRTKLPHSKKIKSDVEKESVPVYWYRTDARLGVYSPGKQTLQVLRFGCLHFHRAFLVDVDGNGTTDIIASGFDARGDLKATVYLSLGQRWRKFTTQTASLRSRNNGLVFVDLDGKPGLEMVRYSDIISWADVYRRTGRGFRKDNSLYSGFASDFYSDYLFFTPGYTKQQLAMGGISDDRKRLYLTYERYLPRAKKILGKTATP